MGYVSFLGEQRIHWGKKKEIQHPNHITPTTDMTWMDTAFLVVRKLMQWRSSLMRFVTCYWQYRIEFPLHNQWLRNMFTVLLLQWFLSQTCLLNVFAHLHWIFTLAHACKRHSIMACHLLLSVFIFSVHNSLSCSQEKKFILNITKMSFPHRLRLRRNVYVCER